ncbi:MAG: peptidylprolyl isomerase [Planctomycetes bacterium]|nr:peptidylprolyl isomerase [Planctomycetota bacterium]
MSERIHSTPSAPKPETRRRTTLVVAGTAGCALAAAVALQLFRADDLPAQTTGEKDEGRAHVTSTRRPLARVNGELIPWESVADECMARYGEEVLENIINRAIILQACKQQGAVVTAEEVEGEIARIAKRFNLEPDQWFGMLEAERNITPLQYRRDVIWPMLALKKLAGESVKVTQENVNEAFVRDYGERVKVRMILLDNMRRAEKVWNDVKRSPDDFERLAQEHSIDPHSRSLGGQIPPIRRFTGNPTLEEAAFKLRENEISPIIQAGANRWVILKCEGRTRQVVTSLDDVHDMLYEQVLEEKTQEAVAKIFTQIKQQARIDNFLTNVSTGGVEQAGGAAPRGPVRTADATRAAEQYPRSPVPRQSAPQAGPASQPPAPARGGRQ